MYGALVGLKVERIVRADVWYETMARESSMMM